MSSDKMIESQRELISTLAAIFFISGFSALIYQVCWQRLLFTGFGVDLTSVTIIISIFMVGLGMGAFYGGRMADKFKENTIFIFCLIEFLIVSCQKYGIDDAQPISYIIYHATLAIFLLFT